MIKHGKLYLLGLINETITNETVGYQVTLLLETFVYDIITKQSEGNMRMITGFKWWRWGQEKPGATTQYLHACALCTLVCKYYLKKHIKIYKNDKTLPVYLCQYY